MSYAVDPGRLQVLVPPGCALDLHDGIAFVSLVAFDFIDTHIRGIAWPGHRNFSEINLRFYVRNGHQRGVCFIREFVPRRAVSILARLIYNEPYRTEVMTSHTAETADTIEVEHRLTLGGFTHRIHVSGTKPAIRPGVDTVDHFLKEHSWGFGTSRGGLLLSYRVDHPQWDIWPVNSFAVDWDWKDIYGPAWGFLSGATPDSVMLACGSAVRVFPKTVVPAYNRGDDECG